MRRMTLFIMIGSLLAACSLDEDEVIQQSSTVCVSSGVTPASYRALNDGIRGSVRFLGEVEELSSISDKMALYGIPELSLTLINGGEIDWTRHYQGEGLESSNEPGCTRLFQAASLSKPVTVMAAMRMNASGVINLDRDVQDYLTDFRLPEGKQSAQNRVTLRNLLTHRAGIVSGGYSGYANDTDLPSDLEVVRGSPGVNSPAVAVVSEPNQMLAYSGGGYTLAELALQNHFEQSFETLMHEWVLRPFGMSHSDFTQPLPEAKWPNAARGHLTSGEMVEGGWHIYPEQAAAGLWTTSQDMARFLVEIYRAYQGASDVFSQQLIQSMLAEEVDRSVYGFIVDRSGGGLSLTHYGGNVGYRTGMTIDLNTGHGLVYLANSDNGGQLGNELLLSASAVYGWSQFNQIEVQRADVDETVLQSLIGSYLWDDQVPVAIDYNDEAKQISLLFPNGDEYSLVPTQGEDLGFIHSSTGVQIRFTRSSELSEFILYGRVAKRQF